jgi:hypothetical protein
MEKHYIVFDGKEYEVQEPTIELWNQLNTLKDLGDHKDFILTLISLATGLQVQEIEQAKWEGVYETSLYLTDYFLNQPDKFFNEFEFKGKKYRFMDLENMTFGEFIDIDSFLQQEQSKRQANMNMLLALLYREVDEDGNIIPYNANDVKDRSQIFRALPVKYLRGSVGFFLRLENILRASSRSYLTRKMFQLKWKIRRHLRGFGGGMLRLYIYLVRTFYKYTRSRKNPL